MENVKKHRLNGDPTGVFKGIQEIDNSSDIEVKEKPKKTHPLIKGLKKMSNPVVGLINNVAGKINELIDMASKIHFSAPYLLIIAALYYKVLPTDPLVMAWLSFIAGGSVALMCVIVWFNESNLKYLYKQKWGVFWIICAQTIVQIMSFSNDPYFGHIVGGICTLISLPFYIYFNMKCEDEAEKAKSN